jgi:hypothetical protein
VDDKEEKKRELQVSFVLIPGNMLIIGGATP